MANRYDIIHIDFQASAKGANAAIESIRQEADKCNTRISELKKNIAEAPKNGTDAKILEGWEQELKVTDRRFRQLTQAQKELMKGMRALDEGVKMFNDGSLSAMNAAFQKTVNNAAKLAQSKLVTGSKEWRDMGALMQETEQNYARMMRDTDQLIESLQNGGTVFRKTLEDEKKGLQDLLQVLPYMGTEYRKASDQLDFLAKKTDEMTIKERQLKGEIVTTDDARRVSLQLTKEGADAARQRAAVADQEIEKGKQEIETLEKEREAREANARASAQAAAKYREDQQMYEDEIDRLQREIKAEEERAASGKTGVEAMYRKAEAAGKAADKEIEAQKKLHAEYETARDKFMALREEYEKMKQAGASAPVKDVAASAEKSIAEETTEASKKKTEAKKEEIKVEKEAVEEQKKEVLSEKELVAALKENKTVIDGLYKERDELIKKQKESAQATREEANAFAELSKEQAEAMLKQKQATVTKGADGKFAYTNAEEAQHFLIESMRQVNPGSANKDSASLDSAGVAKVRAMFMERYGIKDDADALTAIRGLISGENGSLIKGGMMNNAFSRIDLDASKVAAYSKEIKDLTDVINGEVKATKEDSKAVEENAEKKRTLADVDAEIEAREKEQRQNAVLLIKMRNGLGDSTSELSKKNEGLAESHKKSTAAIKEEIEAIKQMNREQAEAKKKEMTTTSTLGWKAGKLDASNLEEAQHYLLTQISKMGTVGKDGTYTLAGQNIDKLLTAFHNKYGEKGKLQESKALLKELVSGKNGGLFNDGGVVDFNSETLMIKANTEAYQGRLKVLKELISITNGTAQAIGKSTEATKKDTDATKSQTDAIKAQEEEVMRRRKAFESKNEDYEAKNAKLKEMKSALGRLPNSGPDALLARQQAKDEFDEYNENVVKPARADKTRLKGLWEKSVKDLLKMKGQDTEETKKNTEAENQNAEATENNTKSKGRKKKASEDAAKATKEETQQSAELLAKEKEMKEAEAEMVAAMERGEAQQKKTNKAVEDAETANEKAKQSEADLVKSLDEKSQKLKENKEGLENLNKANKDTVATNEENQKLLSETNAKIQEQGEKIRDAERIKAQAKTEGIEKTEQAIRLLTEENRHIDQNSFTWKRNTIEIQHLQEALDEMKGKPALMMMEQRMKNVGSLSASAVTETKRFWEAVVAGADKGSDKLAQAEAHLKSITEEEQKRKTEANVKQADKLLNRGYLTMSEAEIRRSIDAAREYQQTLQPTEGHYRTMSRYIAEAENHLKNFGEESLRAARRQEEADNLMRKQLEQGTALSESALRTQQQYWQRLIDDPKTAAESIDAYRIELEKTIELQKQQAEATRNERAAKLGGNLAEMSEGEIREAIEAGKQLIQTYKSASPEAETLAKNIVAAEEHVKQYGVEAQRAAVREAKAVEEANRKRQETNQLMEDQLRRGTSLTESALKQQEQYWQKLIDDPKAAANEIAYYIQQLNKVKDIQKQQADAKVKVGGLSVLQKMRGDADYENKISENQRKEDIAALKAYRDSLPKEGNVSVLKEIDYYLNQLGRTAQEAAKQTMSLADSEVLAGNLGKRGFSATTTQLQQAKKALVDAQQAAGRGTPRFQQLQEAINKVDLELAKTGEIAQNVQRVLDQPKGQSLNALKQAIEQGRAALNSMDRTTVEGQKAFDELAKKIKDADYEMRQLAGTAKVTANAFEKAWNRFKTYIAFYVSAAAAIQRVIATFGDLMELSDKMGEVRKTTGFTAEEVGHLSENLKSLDVRTPLEQLMEVSSKAGQLGLKTVEDVEGFTIAANKLMIALPEMGTEAATEMMRVAIATGEVDKIRKQLQEGTVEGSNATAVAMEKIASTIDRLRASSASTAPEITDFVKRLGAVGAQSGISIDQISALGSTVSSLGMRVEMSATALSRMIPAIKNNAFQVAKAIKVEPETLRNLFAAGRGMEAILMIFQHIKDSGMDEDNIEKLLGMAGMRDVMKQLNQQGARAGIVFAGLSQNVDELRKQLGIASQAYEENIAIQQEFDRMNETTAAKWERFKNELEETFVGDRSQRFLGWVIDQLRLLVNIISGNVEPALKVLNVAIWTTAAYFAELRLGILRLVKGGFVWLIQSLGALKTALTSVKAAGLKDSLHFLALETKQYIALKWQLVTAHTAEEKAAIKAKLANNALAKSMNVNVILAMVAAVAMLIWKLKEWNDEARETAREAGRFEAEMQRETKAANKMIDAVGVARVKMEDAEEAVRKARKELEAAKEANDGTAAAVKRLKDAEIELLVQEEKKRIAMAEHKRLIEQFNTQYSKYLGFMLSEVSSNIELAKARDLVNSKIRETITLKQQEAGLGRVEEQMGGKRDEKYGSIQSLIYEKIKNPTKAARVMQELTKASQREYESLEDYKEEVLKIARKNNVGGNLQPLLNRAKDYYLELKEIKRAQDAVIAQSEGNLSVQRETSQKNLVSQVNEAFRTYNKKLGAYQSANGDDRAKAAAEVLQQMDTLKEMQQSASGYYKMGDKTEEARYKRQMGQLISWQGYNRDELLKAAGKYYTPRKDITGNITDNIKDTTNGGWGGNHPEDSTDWKSMTAEQLVNRRKQMKDFVNAIQDDTDVTRVLKEDSALQKAIENGMSRDVRTVIEWYNDQRLKIQDELHARHLTNTGDWMDPKKAKARKERLHSEWKAYIDELDAYYTERKARIQEAGAEEGISQAEMQNRTIANEVEWRQRRMELQKMYAEKADEVTKEEQDAIFKIISERTGDDLKFVMATYQQTLDFMKAIGVKNPLELQKALGKLDLEIERDGLKMRQNIMKQVQAIQDIIDKERPFNGITKNLRENLVTMGILTADMSKERDRLMKENEDMANFNARQAAEELKRTTFMLGEAENAYTTTIEDVMRHMADKGMTAWADELRQNPKMQEGMMAQLRATYDSIQDAIKKEASQLKKQAEIMWNNILMPDGKTTLKDAVDRTVAQLSLSENRVSRANSLIGAGQASERVADKLAIKQMQLQLVMQEHYYNLMKQRGQAAVDALREQARLAKERHDYEEATRKELDAQHAEQALNLATAKEETELAKQREDIIARTEDSQNRLYTELREWVNLFSSSLQSVFEASHAGDADYYNERAKMNLTGKGGPGAGTYIIIDNEGTEDARAHYEYLDERQALERQHEIEKQNAQAEAWRKVMDDINQKMSESITDWINAFLQNQSIDMNSQELEANNLQLDANTQAVMANTEQLAKGINVNGAGNESEAPNMGNLPNMEIQSSEGSYGFDAEGSTNSVPNMNAITQDEAQEWINGMGDNPMQFWAEQSDAATKTMLKNNNKMQQSTQSMYSAMTAAANLYGAAYQAMSNDNLDTAQKFEMIALQAAGQAAISALNVALSEAFAKTAVNQAQTASKDTAEHGSIVGPILTAISTAVLGGLMGLATSAISKSKSQIAQITGASVSAGRLSTGMLTYAEGNVNEFSDPGSLTPGRHYNVDGADGKTYRAKYMGVGAKTHITNGPEFHLVGEAGREAIIDAHTTRNIQLNEPEIWRSIQTLYNGGSLRHTAARLGRGVRAFAEGNINDFEEVSSETVADTIGFNPEMLSQMQASLDRNSEVMELIVTNGIKAIVSPYGPDGIVAGYDRAKKEAQRHGEKFL